MKERESKKGEKMDKRGRGVPRPHMGQLTTIKKINATKNFNALINYKNEQQYRSTQTSINHFNCQTITHISLPILWSIVWS